MLSGNPYTALLGSDVYRNGRGGARPAGVSRNTLNSSGSAQLDLRLSRKVEHGGKDGQAFTVSLDAFNVLNRVNYAAYVGTVGSPLFGQPVTARAGRQLQLTARFAF